MSQAVKSRSGLIRRDVGSCVPGFAGHISIYAALLISLALVLMMPAKAQTKPDDCTDLYAAKLYQVAMPSCQLQADAKEPAAQFNLALMHYFGQGTVQDYAKAFIWFKKAAKSGHVGAQNNVGYLYFNGQSVPQDYLRAYVWFSLAAASGYQDAARYREMAATKLTQDAKIQGQAMAAACTNSKFEMCE